MWNETEIDMDPDFLKRDVLRKAGKPVEIAETDRLIIRETVREDVPALYAIYDSMKDNPYLKPMQPSLEEEMDFMKAYISHMYAFYDYGLWTVLDKESGRIAGRAGLFPSEILDEGVEFGYLTAPAFQRRGYAREYGTAILSYAFRVLELEEIHLLTVRENLASVRTARALGFREKEIIKRTTGTEEQIMLHFICTGEDEKNGKNGK